MTVTTIRWGGRAGIAAVCAFVIGTFAIAVLLSAAQVAPLEVDLEEDTDRVVIQNVPEGATPVVMQTFRDRFSTFFRSFLSPLLFMGVMLAFQNWMRVKQYPLSGWLYTIGSIGLALWMMSAMTRLFILARITNSPTPPTETNYSFMWIMVSDSLMDSGYFMIALHSFLTGLILLYARFRLVGTVGVVSGLTVMAFLLFNSYDNPTNSLLFIYGYGIPIVWLFSLSALMMLQADHLEDLARTRTGFHRGEQASS